MMREFREMATVASWCWFLSKSIEYKRYNMYFFLSYNLNSLSKMWYLNFVLINPVNNFYFKDYFPRKHICTKSLPLLRSINVYTEKISASLGSWLALTILIPYIAGCCFMFLITINIIYSRYTCFSRHHCFFPILTV